MSLDRKVKRQEYKEKTKAMKIKKRAVQVTLSDKETIVTVHTPSMAQFSQFLESFPIVTMIGKAFAAVQEQSKGGVVNLAAVKIDPATLDNFYPLLAILSDISVEDFKDLPIEDGLSILLAYVQLLAPETLTNPETKLDPTPAAAPPN